MNCEEAQALSIPHIMSDFDPGSKQYQELEAHLAICQVCTEEYESSKETVEFIQEHKAEFAEAFEAIDREKTAEQEEIQRCWKRMEAELDRQEAQERQEKQAKFRRLFVRVSATAACLAIGVFAWITFPTHSTPNTVPKSAPQQVAFVSTPSVKVELVTNTGNIPIPSDQQITSANQLKTLLINGKHRMTMNTYTILAIEPLVKNSNIGCLVKLDSGQIYANVEHDGNLFAVDTACGKAVITGTTFDVKVTDDSTTLIVSEGTVQFKSQDGIVNVTAGQTSEITSQSAPSIPLSCNTAELTAWATGYKSIPALAQAESNTDLSELPLFFGKEPIVLEETDYKNWIEQKQDWFEQEFPWIFQLKEALAREGIEVGYPELLIRTGDVWQFICLEGIPARFSVIDPNSLLNIASNYGFDKKWLLENVPLAKTALEKPALSENSFTGLKALERWLVYLDETKGLTPPTPIYSYHASKYLAETRSLIWFAVRESKYDLIDQERIEILGLLQKEVIAACMCQNHVLYPEEGPKPSCDDDTFKTANEKIVGYIKTMKVVEESITEYEIVR